jgi:hypothetical protein
MGDLTFPPPVAFYGPSPWLLPCFGMIESNFGAIVTLESIASFNDTQGPATVQFFLPSGSLLPVPAQSDD